MTLPGEYKFGFVVGRFLQMVADTAGDIDPYPDPRPAKGTVTFTPHERQRKVSQDFTAFVGHATVGASLGPSGQIIDAEGRDGIWLIEGTHTVRVTNDAGIVVPDFDVTVTPDHTLENPLDLVTAAPPQPGPGVTLQTVLVPPGGGPDETLVRGDNGALVWMPVDEIGPKGDPGDPGEPGPPGPKGDTGAPGALADASSYIITGPGRPDVPATTGGIITGAEPVGAEFRSTDGAGVGAWVWMKRPDGWEVTDLDTGWRSLTGMLDSNWSGTLLIRATTSSVQLVARALDGSSATGDTIVSSTQLTPFMPERATQWLALAQGSTNFMLRLGSQVITSGERGSSGATFTAATWPRRKSVPTTLPGSPA